jgi:hypothetical protein
MMDWLPEGINGLISPSGSPSIHLISFSKHTVDLSKLDIAGERVIVLGAVVTGARLLQHWKWDSGFCL